MGGAISGSGEALPRHRFTPEQYDQIDQLAETYVADGAALEVMRLAEIASVYRAYQEELARRLREWAARVNMLKIKKSPPRKPTKNKTKRIKDKGPHLSTARLLEEAKEQRRTKSKARKQP